MQNDYKIIPLGVIELDYSAIKNVQYIVCNNFFEKK